MIRLAPPLVAAITLGTVATGCYDLEITNPNSPTSSAAYANPDAVETMIGDSFRRWYTTAQTEAAGEFGRLLSTASFQHSSPACAPSFYSTIPRTALPGPGEAYYWDDDAPWYGWNDALVQVALALRVLDENAQLRDEMAEAEIDRLRAFGRFVQGLGHGSLALLYDRAAIVDENTLDVHEDRLLEHRELMERALRYLYEAAERSAGAEWPAIPAEWMSVEVSPDQLARLAHSFAARFRAGVARLPHHRSTADWDAVIADVDAGINETWTIHLDWSSWFNAALYYSSLPQWSLETYFIIGMADQSGDYQRWLLQDIRERIPNPVSNGDGTEDPVLIVTPDTRFPQGATLAEQEANPGSLYVIPNGLEGQIGGEDRAWDIRTMWYRPERGTWRWSYYWSVETEPYWRQVDGQWPEISMAEMRLLKAEGLLRKGQLPEAAGLINMSRTAAGLSPTDGAGTNTDCVPRLPDGTCGDLMEMLKWEKRLETRMKGLFNAPWYFDARGWGDLYAGTFLQAPVPCEELILLNEPCITFGGVGGQSASPGSSYSWFDEN
ncbi:MAG: hypothetical protein R6U63_16090 [Longimicrobiales bacterium]